MRIRPADHNERLRIEFVGGKRVTGLRPAEREIDLDDGSAIGYDKLLIASGASANRQEIEGAGPGDVFVMRTMADAEALLAAIDGQRKRVAVLGAGLVSLKTAGALAEHGQDITIIVTSQHILSQQFDHESADVLRRRLEEGGVRFIFGASAARLLHGDDGGCQGLELDTGEVVPCDLVFMGKGVHPNTSFVPPEFTLCNGAIEVDDRLRTSVSDVWAAGDVAMPTDRLTGTRASYAIWPNATEQGAIAGANMAGADLAYAGTVSMNSLSFFGLGAICGGDGRGREPGSTVEVISEPHYDSHRRFVFADGRLTGFVLIGRTANAGILMGQLGTEMTLSECLRLLDNGVVARMHGPGPLEPRAALAG